MSLDGMTAPELAAHLSELCNDQEFVLKAVQLKFPQYEAMPKPRRLTEEEARKSVRRAKKAYYNECNYTKPDATTPWYDCTDSVKKIQSDIANGSKALLRAIHRAHPQVMHHAKQAGRLVVYP